MNPWRGESGLRVESEAEEGVVWGRRIEAAETVVIVAAGCAIGEVRVGGWVPLELDSGGEELLEETEKVGLAGLLSVGERVVGGSAVREEVGGVFDEVALVGAVGAVGERRG